MRAFRKRGRNLLALPLAWVAAELAGRPAVPREYALWSRQRSCFELRSFFQGRRKKAAHYQILHAKPPRAAARASADEPCACRLSLV
jgi:hypothetical protein